MNSTSRAVVRVRFIVDERPDVVLDRALGLFNGPAASE
jgi:hypothetical protein